MQSNFHTCRYWQSIVLKFRDGFQATVRLDAPTIAKLEAGGKLLVQLKLIDVGKK